MDITINTINKGSFARGPVNLFFVLLYFCNLLLFRLLKILIVDSGQKECRYNKFFVHIATCIFVSDPVPTF